MAVACGGRQVRARCDRNCKAQQRTAGSRVARSRGRSTAEPPDSMGSRGPRAAASTPGGGGEQAPGRAALEGGAAGGERRGHLSGMLVPTCIWPASGVCPHPTPRQVPVPPAGSRVASLSCHCFFFFF